MFASRLRYLRQSKELNQTQLGEKLGVKKQSVSNWENGNIVPSIDMLIKIADYFHVSTDYLLGRDNPASDGFALMDVTGLTQVQVEHIQRIVDDLRRSRE